MRLRLEGSDSTLSCPRVFLGTLISTYLEEGSEDVGLRRSEKDEGEEGAEASIEDGGAHAVHGLLHAL